MSFIQLCFIILQQPLIMQSIETLKHSPMNLFITSRHD